MRFAELDGRLVQYEDGGALRYVSTVPEAHGAMFLCPGCYRKNGGAVGTHQILIWFAGRDVPAGVPPAHRWEVSGGTVEDVTLAPSVLVHADALAPAGRQCPGWHGFVRGGVLVDC